MDPAIPVRDRSAERSLAVIGNPRSGTSDEGALAAVTDRWREQGHTVDLWWPDDEDALDALIADLEDRRVVVAGGDGSVSVVVNALDRAGRLDLDVAILPFGTGNDAAGGLGVDDLTLAAAAAVGSDTRRVDLIRSEAGVAVNAVHLGIGADAARRSVDWKPSLGRLAYPVSAVVAGASSEPFQASIRIDDEVVDGRFSLVGLGNGHRIGGGFPLFSDAAHDDRAMTVVLVEADTPAERVRFAVAARDGDHGDLDGVTIVRAARVEIHAERDVEVNRDGELTGPRRTLTATLDPAALTLCAPST